MTPAGLAMGISGLVEVGEAGQWQRHASLRRSSEALDGYAGQGRWGTKTGFPVLYLGRPTDSVVVEAYRHQVDPLIFDSDQDRQTFLAGVLPRVLITCAVEVTRLLDLRTATARAAVGLTVQDLTSPADDRQSYARCQLVAQVAHQLGRHGIVAPAATQRGETLVLFTDRLPVQEQPRRVGQDLAWQTLPPDPRAARTTALRLVRDDG